MSDRQCPVCGMKTKDSAIEVKHLGLTYAFCSQQCRKNFTAHPSLYIGRKRAQTQRVIKHRRFMLARPISGDQHIHVHAAIKAWMGVQDVRLDGDRLFVTYNLLEIKAEQLEKALADIGVSLSDRWIERCRRSWVHYTEANELDHLAAGASACCNKPPAKGK